MDGTGISQNLIASVFKPCASSLTASLTASSNIVDSSELAQSTDVSTGGSRRGGTTAQDGSQEPRPRLHVRLLQVSKLKIATFFDFILRLLRRFLGAQASPTILVVGCIPASTTLPSEDVASDYRTSEDGDSEFPKPHPAGACPVAISEADTDVPCFSSFRLYDLGRWLTRARRRINARASIYRLPPEIIGEIFVFATVSPLSSSSIRAALKLSHVSHYLRSAAISDYRLWTTLYTGLNVPLLEKCLRRSKQARVDTILVSPHGPKVTRLLEEIERTRLLHLQIYGSAEHVVLPSTRAPALRDLTIQFRYTTVFTTPFDHLVMQRLAYLAISGAPLSVLQTLRRPMLHTILIEDVQRADMDLRSLLNILRQLPLQIFCLKHGVPQLPTSATRVALRYLHTLELAGSLSSILLFLRSVSVPRITRLILKVTSPVSDLEVPALSRVILSRLGLTRRGKPLRTAVVESPRPGTVHYRAWTSHAEINELSTYMKRWPILDLTFPAELDAVVNALTSGFLASRLTTYVFYPAAHPHAVWDLHRSPRHSPWLGPEPHLKGTYLAVIFSHGEGTTHLSKRDASGSLLKRSLSL